MRVFDTPINTNDQSIDRVLNAGLPVALVFLEGPAPSSLDSTLRRLAQELSGDVLIAMVQVKDNPETTRRYSIRQVPSVITLKNGQAYSRAEGILPSELDAHIAYLLGRGPKPVTASSTASQATPGTGRSSGATTGGTANRPSSAAAAGPQVVTDATFENEVMRSPIPVLVDFWAPWCGPCRMTNPVLEKLSRELNRRLKIAKVNVDENPNLSYQYSIQSIPTMMVVRDGRIVDRWMGALPEPALRSRISSHI